MHALSTPTQCPPRLPHATAYTVLRYALALLLLFAATMKALDVPSYLLIAQVQFEIILALWLLSNFRPRLCWLVTLLCFALFAAISLHKALRGDASCGCFGRLSVNPYFTATLDALAVAALLLLSRGISLSAPSHMGLRILALSASIALLCIPTTFYLLRSLPKSPTDSGELPAGDGFIHLQPDTWLQKPFPLLRHTSLGDQLAHGRWIVVIYNSYCGHCRPAVPEYEQLAIALQDRPGSPRIALIEIPPVAPPGRNQATGLTPAVVGHLSPSRKWLAVTPIILALENGQILALNANQPPEPWLASVFPQR